MKIETYQSAPPKFLPWDPEFPVVAGKLGALLLNEVEGIEVEHVGSTSVPECGGKGVVDLLVLFRPGELDRVREAVDALGFQKQKGGHLFPEERPMRVGAIEHHGRFYRCHLHLLVSGCEEVERLIRFREDLRAHPGQRQSYMEIKKQIIQKQIDDPEEYTDQKALFFTKHVF